MPAAVASRRTWEPDTVDVAPGRPASPRIPATAPASLAFRRCSSPTPSGRPVAGSASGRRTAASWGGAAGARTTSSAPAATTSPSPPPACPPFWASPPRRRPGRSRSGSASCSPAKAAGPSRPLRTGPAAGRPSNVLPLPRGGRRGPRRAPALHPWLVPTLRVPAGVALELLLSRRADSGAPERKATEGPLASGAGWAWCAALADEALEMAAGGRAVPAVLRAADGRAEARWLPAPTAADGERLRALVESIPAVCRAEAERPATGRHRRRRRSSPAPSAISSTPPCGHHSTGAAASHPAGGGWRRRPPPPRRSWWPSPPTTHPAPRRRRPRQRRGTATGPAGLAPQRPVGHRPAADLLPARPPAGGRRRGRRRVPTRTVAGGDPAPVDRRPQPPRTGR